MATIDGSLNLFKQAKCRRFLEARFAQLSALFPFKSDAGFPAVQSTLLDLVNEAPVNPRDLGHCLELLSGALDAIDEGATPENGEEQQICEHLFEMITNRGVWGIEDADRESEFVGLTAL